MSNSITPLQYFVQNQTEKFPENARPIKIVGNKIRDVLLNTISFLPLNELTTAKRERELSSPDPNAKRARIDPSSKSDDPYEEWSAGIESEDEQIDPTDLIDDGPTTAKREREPSSPDPNAKRARIDLFDPADLIDLEEIGLTTEDPQAAGERRADFNSLEPKAKRARIAQWLRNYHEYERCAGKAEFNDDANEYYKIPSENVLDEEGGAEWIQIPLFNFKNLTEAAEALKSMENCVINYDKAVRLEIECPRLLNKETYQSDGYLAWEYVEGNMIDGIDPDVSLAEQEKEAQNHLAQIKRLYSICYEHDLYLDLTPLNLRVKADGTIVPISLFFNGCWDLEAEIGYISDDNVEIFNYLCPDPAKMRGKDSSSSEE